MLFLEKIILFPETPALGRGGFGWTSSLLSDLRAECFFVGDGF